MSGVAAHEVWVSDGKYEQDYANLTQRCSVGVAPDSCASLYPPCVARGRFVRLRLVGTDVHGERGLVRADRRRPARPQPASCPQTGPLWTEKTNHNTQKQGQ